MVLFLLTSTPIAGILLLNYYFPGWVKSDAVFTAGGRGFLFFWLFAAICFLGGAMTGEAYSLGESFALRFFGKELPLMAVAALAMLLWKPLRKRELSERELILELLLFSGCFHLLSGAGELLIRYKNYNGYGLFFQPLVLIAGIPALLIAGICFARIYGWKRWVIPPVVLLSYAALAALPPAFDEMRRFLPAAISACLLTLCVFFAGWFSVKKLVPGFYRRA